MGELLEGDKHGGLLHDDAIPTILRNSRRNILSAPLERTPVYPQDLPREEEKMTNRSTELPVGRPPADKPREALVKKSCTIPAEVAELIIEIGDGNFSRGVRALAKHIERKRPKWK